MGLLNDNTADKRKELLSEILKLISVEYTKEEAENKIIPLMKEYLNITNQKGFVYLDENNKIKIDSATEED